VALTGDLPTGKSAAAATLSMAKNEAITITMIFMMLSLGLDTQTVDRVILRRVRRGALQHS
jgi:hypothetical protein